MNKLTNANPDTRSADLAEENFRRIATIFPEAVSEGGIDFDVLRQLLGDDVDDQGEKYGLNWHGKRAARRLALTPSAGTLRPCPEESVNWTNSQNLLIEGDNLEVLKLLQKSYAGKVKLIYIDPPYNTGNDFIYPDKFEDALDTYLALTGQTGANGERLLTNPESSGRFHTAWLNMIYPRLRLARDLLTRDGFIAISIDDSEVANLRLVCDDIFGGDNFIATVVWQKKYTRANDATFFSTNHDYVLIYARDSATAALGTVPRNERQLQAYSNPDNHPKGAWKATPLHARSGSNTKDYLFSNGTKWAPPPGTYRRFSDDSMKALEEDDAIWFGSDGSQVPSRKSFLSEMEEGIVPVTFWDYQFAGHNHQANNELKELGLGGCFTSPKPTLLMRRLIELAVPDKSDDLVMDFFAGSGTLGHAVMLQNAEDGGARRYVLVQLPEPLDPENTNHRLAAALCETLGVSASIAELTKERLRRAATQIHSASGSDGGDFGFRVFKLASSNIRGWDAHPEDPEQALFESIEHVRPERTEEDILYELLLKLGLDLVTPIEQRFVAGKTVHNVGAGTLIACLAEHIDRSEIEDLALGIVSWREELDPAAETVVVFRDDAFADDVAKTNISAILEQHGMPTVRSL